MPFVRLTRFFYQRNSAFRRKILVGFLLSSILPVLLIGSLAYSFSYKIARDSIIQSITYANIQLSNTISNRFLQGANAADILPAYLFPLVQAKGQSIVSQLDRVSQIRSYLAIQRDAYQFYQIVVYLNPDYLASSEGLTFKSTAQLSERGIDLAQLRNNTSAWNLSLDQTASVVVKQRNNIADLISVYRGLRRTNSPDWEYLFFIDLDAAEIGQQLQQANAGSGIHSYLADQEGRIVADPEQSRLGQVLRPSELELIRQAGAGPQMSGSTLVLSQKIAANDWQIVTEVPQSYIISRSRILVSLILVTLLMTVFFTVSMVIFLSRNLSQKVRQLSGTISRLSTTTPDQLVQDLTPFTHRDPRAMDEIDQLAIVFQTMFRQQHENASKLLAISVQKERLEYQLLQAKINPHFLYNILESIRLCNSSGHLPEAQRMLVNLGQFYRLSLRKGDDLVTIEDELEIAELYLDLEKVSRKDAFSWTISKDEFIEQFMIPKFTLQPILENCILHGTPPGKQRLEITLSAVLEDERIRMTVQDNGRGIEPVTLARIRETLASKTIQTSQFYGLNNVNKRLATYSSGEARLMIDSQPGKGTTVTLTFDQILKEIE